MMKEMLNQMMMANDEELLGHIYIYIDIYVYISAKIVLSDVRRYVDLSVVFVCLCSHGAWNNCEMDELICTIRCL